MRFDEDRIDIKKKMMHKFKYIETFKFGYFELN